MQSWFWKPADLIADHSRRDGAAYDVWAKQGHLIAVPGRVIDPMSVALKIIDLCGQFNVVAMAYDRWKIETLLKEFDRADFLAQEGVGEGLRVEAWGQGFGSMGEAINALETGILADELSHDANPVLTRCMMSAVVVSDAAGNRKLDKGKSTGRIDGAVALAMACGLKARDRADDPVPMVSPWEDPDFSLSAYN